MCARLRAVKPADTFQLHIILVNFYLEQDQNGF